ncbi:hypothetical protein QBC34DRAFT_382361 [Podospora aff. communis PSN243]|uniref:Uncharacterized protein n=1 Tax=Podospora aff. communis PSN243 TaxID=3040156 RepID=A0AAV9GGV6_9PEZI|nr:hypothetical protein QBC34DRAFT_382361 [Podospora aff. communis PSN243]
MAFPGPGETGDITTFPIAVPRDLKILDDSKIRGRMLGLTEEDIMQFFDPTISGIIDLISRQVFMVEHQRLEVTHVFMSGGFAESPYLCRKIEEWARHKAPLQVDRGDNCWAAIALGAALKVAGVNSSIPTPITTCPRSYGIIMSQFLAAHKGFNESDIFWHEGRKEQMAKGRITWLVQKGDFIPFEADAHGLKTMLPTVFTVGTEVQQISEIGRHERASAIWMSNTFLVYFMFATEVLIIFVPENSERIDVQLTGAEVPEREWKLRRAPKGRRNYEVSVNVELRVTSNVRVKLTCGMTEVASQEFSL